MDMQVQVVGLDKLMADVSKAGGNADSLVTAALVNSTNKVQSNARVLAAHRTGALQNSILPEVRGLNALVKVNEKYGRYIEGGTGIYGPSGMAITPKRGKALMFTSGGKTIFVKSVKGMRGRPFFKPGIEQSLTYIHQQFQQVLALLTTGLAGRG